MGNLLCYDALEKFCFMDETVTKLDMGSTDSFESYLNTPA